MLVGSVANNMATGIIDIQSDYSNIGCGIDGCGTFNNYGTIKGNGTLYVNQGLGYTNNGTFAPGASVGILTFVGHFTSSTVFMGSFELVRHLKPLSK